MRICCATCDHFINEDANGNGWCQLWNGDEWCNDYCTEWKRKTDIV